MKPLDNRGAVAWEFVLVALPLFILIFVIFDLARYALTVQSLQTLADTAARAVIIGCYEPDTIANNTVSARQAAIKADCISASTTTHNNQFYPLASSTDTYNVKNAAPFLYFGLTPPQANACVGSSAPAYCPSATVTTSASALTVTASPQPSFAMLMPIWGTSLNAPTVSTSIPF
jgi:Flp pilus assembly protein TadG